MRKIGFAIALVVLMSAFVVAEDSSVKIDNDFVHRAFGKEFTLIPEMGAMVGDLDGDGVEDIAIAARCKNPLLDAAEHDYTVLDPYYSFYGYGDPKLTMSFGAEEPSLRALVVLIIHGSGPDAWRAENAKSKFVIINLPYRQISVRKFTVAKKKKPVMAIFAEESNSLKETSALYFDGKTYKYVPMGSSME
jgi:hypothetical protein